MYAMWDHDDSVGRSNKAKSPLIETHKFVLGGPKKEETCFRRGLISGHIYIYIYHILTYAIDIHIYIYIRIYIYIYIRTHLM